HFCIRPLHRLRQGGLPGKVYGRRTANNTARLHLPAFLRTVGEPADVVAAVRHRVRDSVLAAGGSAVSQEDLSEDLATRSPVTAVIARHRRHRALVTVGTGDWKQR